MDQTHLSVNQREADQDHHCDGLRRDRDWHRLQQGSRSRAGNPSDLAGFAFGSYREGRYITGNRTRLRHRAFFRAVGGAFRRRDHRYRSLEEDAGSSSPQARGWQRGLPASGGRGASAPGWLRRGGYVCVRNGTRESGFPHRHFFPRLRALIASGLPSRRAIRSVFAVGGFTPIVHRVVTQVTAPDWPSFIEKSTLRADSFLARLSDDDFQRGMAALRTPGNAINQNDAVTEEIDWFVFLRHG